MTFFMMQSHRRKLTHDIRISIVYLEDSFERLNVKRPLLNMWSSKSAD